MICLTGDFITAGDTTTLDGYVDVLRLLSSQAPTYAVYGNHDGGVWSRGRGGEETPGRAASLLSTAGIQFSTTAPQCWIPTAARSDTHGGQVAIPFFGPPFVPLQLPP